jgi:hypothetical protein
MKYREALEGREPHKGSEEPLEPVEGGWKDPQGDDLSRQQRDSQKKKRKIFLR